MNNKHTLISTSKLQMAGAHLLEIGDYSCYPPSSIIKEDNNMKHTKGKWEVKIDFLKEVFKIVNEMEIKSFRFRDINHV